MGKRKKILLISVAIAILIFISFFNEIINFITNYQWFHELGYEEVFLTKMKTQLTLGVPIFVASTLFYYIYLIILKKDYYKKAQVYEFGISQKRTNQILMIPSIFLGFVTASSISGKLWFNLLNYFYSEEFKVVDPIFNKDISFYIFKLPVIEQLLGIFIGLIMALVVVTFIFYMFMFFAKQPTYYTSEQEMKWNTNIF